MAEYLSSRTNPRVKAWRDLVRRPTLEPRGDVLLEGRRLCAEAMASGAVIREALFAERASPEAAALFADLPAEVPVFRLSDAAFESVSATATPQGLAVVAASPVVSIEQLDRADRGDWLVLEQVQDPGNVGAMIRSADAFGFAGVLITPGCAWPMQDKALRASMGSVFHLDLGVAASLAEAVGWLRRQSVVVWGTAPEDGFAPDERLRNRKCPCAIVIGNEASGMSAQARSLCDGLIRIPMPGRAESLNAAVAAGILAYECSRNR